MKRLARLGLLILLLAWSSLAWGQRLGTLGQDGQWNLAHVGSVTHATLGISPHITTFAVVSCGTTAAVAVTPKVDTLGRRRDVQIQNIGTVNVYVGGTHATITTGTGFTLHAASVSPATSRVELSNFQGRVDCIADDVGQQLRVLEIWR